MLNNYDFLLFIVYVSKNQFIGWRGNKFIIPLQEQKKEYKNCKRCLDKFISKDEICDEYKTN